jgi:hypothetical protein
MKKQMNLLKLTGVAALVAAASVGCASSGQTSTAGVNGSDRSTVTALSFVPETRPAVLNKWPIEWNLRSIDTYTWVVDEPGASMAANGNADFNADLPAGSVFVEAAGADSVPAGRRVIRHSPNPR